MNHEGNSTSELASQHTTNTTSKEVSRRKKSPQRVDMTGKLAFELEDFNKRFQNVLQAQGYTGLSLQPGEGPSVEASAIDNGDYDDDDDSSTVFNYYESVINERAIPVGTEDTSPSDEEGSRNYMNNNKNKKPLWNSKTGSIEVSDNGDRDAPANKVGIGDGGNLSIFDQSFFRREPKESRLVERKRHVDEIQRLNKTIGALAESLRGGSGGVGGNNTNTIGKSRNSNTRFSESDASVSFVRRGAKEDSTVPTKSVEELISEESSSMHSSIPATTTITLTYTPQKQTRESFDREVATGGPMEDEDYACDHDKSALSIVLNATTSTCSTGKNATGGPSVKEECADAKQKRKLYSTGLILFAVLGIVGLGIYLGYMSYMIRANNQL